MIGAHEGIFHCVMQHNLQEDKICMHWCSPMLGFRTNHGSKTKSNPRRSTCLTHDADYTLQYNLTCKSQAAFTVWFATLEYCASFGMPSIESPDSILPSNDGSEIWNWECTTWALCLHLDTGSGYTISDIFLCIIRLSVFFIILLPGSNDKNQMSG